VRVIVRSPGFVMNMAAIVGALSVSVHYLGQMAASPNLADTTYMRLISSGLPGDVGYFVAGSVVALALFRRLSPRPVWTDNLGCAMGWVWVARAVLAWARLYVHLLG